VVEDYVSHRFLPVAQDHGPNGDDEPSLQLQMTNLGFNLKTCGV
jgi:hypothetical protein